ncbi:MAG: DUF1573 domain-containing protein [Gemmataceae bacterium]|nr:DUF1573 domain-containing protein [Gemmataceae bacterium]
MRRVQAIAGVLSLLGAGYLLVAGSLRSQPPAGRPEPALTLSPAVHDFGEVEPTGGNLIARFELSNTYDMPVEVVEVVKGCSCADAAVEPRTIPAGGAGVLTVVWRVAGKRGRAGENIVLVCKVGARTEPVPARVTAFVAAALEPDREAVSFRRTGCQAETVAFRPRDDMQFRLTGVMANHPSLTPAIDPDGRSMTVNFDPSQTGWESGRLSVTVVTDAPGIPNFTINVIIEP